MGTAGAVTAFLDAPFRDPAGRTMVTAHPLQRAVAPGGVPGGGGERVPVVQGADRRAGAPRGGAGRWGFLHPMNEKVAAVPAGSRGLLVLPYFAARPRPATTRLRAARSSGSLSPTPFSLARAFMEGITLDMKDMVNSMVRSGVVISEARLLGGPTRSRVWNQIQADVYGVPGNDLESHRCHGARGRDPGGVGAGVFPSIPEGAEAMVRLGERYEPTPRNAETYARLYEAYCRAYEGLDKGGVFAALAGISKIGFHPAYQAGENKYRRKKMMKKILYGGADSQRGRRVRVRERRQRGSGGEEVHLSSSARSPTPWSMRTTRPSWRSGRSTRKRCTTRSTSPSTGRRTTRRPWPPWRP